MNQTTDNPNTPSVPVSGAAQPRPSLGQDLKQWSSQELFHGTREVLIEHFGQAYRLRITHANKLILTK